MLQLFSTAASLLFPVTAFSQNFKPTNSLIFTAWTSTSHITDQDQRGCWPVPTSTCTIHFKHRLTLPFPSLGLLRGRSEECWGTWATPASPWCWAGWPGDPRKSANEGRITFPQLSVRSEQEYVKETSCASLQSHHHEDKGDGHEDAGEAHDGLVGWNGHGHGCGGVGHQRHRQREDKKSWGRGLETWAK